MNLQLVYQYSLSLSKNEKKFYEKTKQNKTKQKDQKQRQKKFPTARVEPRTSALSIAPRQLILLTSRKLIIFNTLAHEILPVDAVCSR